MASSSSINRVVSFTDGDKSKDDSVLDNGLETEEILNEPVDLENLNLRYKLSHPEFIFEEKCLPETCIDPELPSHSVASILNEVFSGLKLDQGIEGLRGAAQAFVPVGPMVSPEIKRTEFMAYLRKTGFIQDIATFLLALYDVDELPAEEDGIEFIARTLGYGLTVKAEVPAKRAYKEVLLEQVKKFQRERDILRRILDNFESSSNPIDVVDPENLPPLEMLENDQEIEELVFQDTSVQDKSMEFSAAEVEVIEIKGPSNLLNTHSMTESN